MPQDQFGFTELDVLVEQMAAHNLRLRDDPAIRRAERRRQEWESRVRQEREVREAQVRTVWGVADQAALEAVQRSLHNGRLHGGLRTYPDAIGHLKMSQAALPGFVEHQTMLMSGDNLDEAVDAASKILRLFGSEPTGDEQLSAKISASNPGLAWERETHDALEPARRPMEAVRGRVERLAIEGTPDQRADARRWQRQLTRAGAPKRRGRPARGTDREIFVAYCRFLVIARKVKAHFKTGSTSVRERVRSARCLYRLDDVAQKAALTYPALINLFGVTEEYTLTGRLPETEEEIALLLVCSMYRRSRERVQRIVREFNFGGRRG
jgi:hypothetical protein